jgi:hypothetical protein
MEAPSYFNSSHARWFKELNSGQKAGFFLNKFPQEGGSPWYEIGFGIGDTEKQIKSWWNGKLGGRAINDKSTGKSGLEGLMWAKGLLRDMIEENRLQPGLMIVQGTDEKRFRAYGKGLKRMGFHFKPEDTVFKNYPNVEGAALYRYAHNADTLEHGLVSQSSRWKKRTDILDLDGVRPEGKITNKSRFPNVSEDEAIGLRKMLNSAYKNRSKAKTFSAELTSAGGSKMQQSGKRAMYAVLKNLK